MNDGAGAAAESLVECVRGVGFEGPVLLVACSDDVGHHAPPWAAAFARVGLVHRVRVVSGIAAAPTGSEVDDIAAESANLGAALVVVVAECHRDPSGGGAADLAVRLHEAARRPAAVWRGGTLSVLPDAR